MENEKKKKKKGGHWAETLKDFPVLNLYLTFTYIHLCIGMTFRHYLIIITT